MMKAYLAILAMMLFANSVHCADADRKPLDEESFRSYMAEEYDLIGRKPDSTATYTGRVTLRDEEGYCKSCGRSKAKPTNALLDSTP